MGPVLAPIPSVLSFADAGFSELTQIEVEPDDDDDAPEPTDEVDLAALAADGGAIYSAELDDAELTRRWVEDLPSLGSISVGVAEAGRLVNGVQMPAGDAWTRVAPENAWGTQETIDFLTAAATAVHDEFPSHAPLRINHIGKQNGGYLRPHQSHQSGRDVDLGFYFPPGVDPARLPKRREQAMDLGANWALVRALVTKADVQFILVDRRIQKLLYDFALKKGEDKAWLDRLFNAGEASLIRHARRHRDHFHVRFFAARSQELGRRIQPLLAKQPEQNVVIHRVCKGETLGGIATRFGSTVKMIQRANGMTTTSLRVGRTLNVPLRGPCTQCPLPPPVIVPPRALPPAPPPES